MILGLTGVQGLLKCERQWLRPPLKSLCHGLISFPVLFSTSYHFLLVRILNQQLTLLSGSASGELNLHWVIGREQEKLVYKLI